MTFARLRAIDPGDPGARLRLEYPASEGESFAVLAEERVLPERVLRADANNVESFGVLELGPADVAWLHEALGDLLHRMEIDAIPVLVPDGWGRDLDAIEYEHARTAEPDHRDEHEHEHEHGGEG